MSIELYDILSEPIVPGNLILYAVESTMKMGIVYSMASSGISGRVIIQILSMKDKYSYGYDQNGVYKRQNDGYRSSKYRIFTNKNNSESRILVLKNPLFHINKKGMAKQVKIVEVNKSLGVLPPDYMIGNPL